MNWQAASAHRLRNSVNGFADHVEKSAFDALACRHFDRAAQVKYFSATGKTFSGVHRNGTHTVFAKVVLNFQHYYLAVVFRHLKGIQNIW